MAMVFNHDLPRRGYKKNEPVNYVTFNALRNNRRMGGDERKNFVKVRKEGEEEFKKVIKVDEGDRFTIRIYFHNNADPSLGIKGFALNTNIHYTSGFFCCFEDEWVDYLEKSEGDCDGFMGYIEWANIDNERVQDFCVIDKPECRTYDYIEGSSRITTKAGTHPFPDYGGQIGIGCLDGVIPPGEFGYVEMDFVVVKYGDEN